MCSLTKRLHRALVLAAIWMPLAAHAGEPASTDNRLILNAQIEAAIDAVAQDPDLGAKKEVRTLRWTRKKIEEPKPKPKRIEWLYDFLQWFGQSSRIFVWSVIGLFVALGVLLGLRYLRAYANRVQSAPTADAPTHVRDLDIRPESLPDDIGAAAWQRWDAGELREALSLLYRGMLSRLAHTHAVPIRDSTTEGDCLELARTHLPPERHAYIAALLRAWQQYVYGDRRPQDADVRALCDEFAHSLRPNEITAP